MATTALSVLVLIVVVLSGRSCSSQICGLSSEVKAPSQCQLISLALVSAQQQNHTVLLYSLHDLSAVSVFYLCAVNTLGVL